MDANDIKLMDRLLTMSADFDGHLSILKFTTNWRISFATPSSREDIDEMVVGDTFELAARAALLGGLWLPTPKKTPIPD
ncbi:hypothetical protein NKJ84_01590 [Mesorhizobium sp. M0048]|uniref:hypothetical protein n=1 Tax=Mesorhizobium sp. M0048 TaxID=2956860 RepID=UPI00333D41AC